LSRRRAFFVLAVTIASHRREVRPSTHAPVLPDRGLVIQAAVRLAAENDLGGVLDILPDGRHDASSARCEDIPEPLRRTRLLPNLFAASLIRSPRIRYCRGNDKNDILNDLQPSLTAWNFFNGYPTFLNR